MLTIALHCYGKAFNKLTEYYYIYHGFQSHYIHKTSEDASLFSCILIRFLNFLGDRELFLSLIFDGRATEWFSNRNLSSNQDSK